MTARTGATGCRCSAGEDRLQAAAAVTRSVSAAGVVRRSSYAVLPTAVERVRQAVREYVEYVSNHEPGTLSYSVVQPANDPSEFVHCAVFADRAAFDASQTSAAYLRFVEVLRPALARQVSVEITEGAAVAEGGSRWISRSDVSVQVRLTVKRRSDLPRFRRLVVEFTHRRQDGLLASDAFRAPGDDRVFFIYERWSSQAALDAALGSPLQLALLDLATLETEQPFSIT